MLIADSIEIFKEENVKITHLGTKCSLKFQVFSKFEMFYNKILGGNL